MTNWPRSYVEWNLLLAQEINECVMQCDRIQSHPMVYCYIVISYQARNRNNYQLNLQDNVSTTISMLDYHY
jgi:hypothetical protein